MNYPQYQLYQHSTLRRDLADYLFTRRDLDAQTEKRLSDSDNTKYLAETETMLREIIKHYKEILSLLSHADDSAAATLLHTAPLVADLAAYSAYVLDTQLAESVK